MTPTPASGPPSIEARAATDPVRLAIIGVGNCASALVQGMAAWAQRPGRMVGVGLPEIGGLSPADIEVVAAVDVDARKVGRPLHEALFAPPNCARRFAEVPCSGVMVEMGPVLDGVAPHMAGGGAQAFEVAARDPVDLTALLRGAGAEVAVCFLPVGSDAATRVYAASCLEAGVAFVNCAPNFIASDPAWAERFLAAGVPLLGDDIKSQFGATLLHRQLVRTMEDRGVRVLRTYQLNTGGNTDFRNMLARERLQSKKLSKTRAVQTAMDAPLPERDIHVGPSDYVPWLEDEKVCFLRVEGENFGGAPVRLELRLSVQDSPNSAGVVINAARCAALARRSGRGGILLGPSAWMMKSPPVQLRDELAHARTLCFIEDCVRDLREDGCGRP